MNDWEKVVLNYRQVIWWGYLWRVFKCWVFREDILFTMSWYQKGETKEHTFQLELSGALKEVK